MKIPPSLVAAILSASAVLAVVAQLTTTVQDKEAGMGDGAAFAEMMEKAQRYTQPGPHHEILSRFVGTWDTEMSLIMGGQKTPPTKGVAETTWLMEGRWLQTNHTGEIMGQPLQSYTLLGYDNFKMSYVSTAVSSMDTAMTRAEGDLDPRGDVLLMWGTIDEYLTGEHDKMVKVVWRLLSDDEMVHEIHDMPIGEHNTQVLEVRYIRRK